MACCARNVADPERYGFDADEDVVRAADGGDGKEEVLELRGAGEGCHADSAHG